MPLAALTTTSQPDSYSEVLPIEGPPSFRGQSVKYVYKLTIGCQRVNSPITLLRVPLRVLVLTGKQGLLEGRAGEGPCQSRNCLRGLARGAAGKVPGLSDGARELGRKGGFWR